MNKLTKIVITLCLAVASFAAFAQKGGGFDMGKMVTDSVTKMDTEAKLKLTGAQKSKLISGITALSTKMQSAFMKMQHSGAKPDMAKIKAMSEKAKAEGEALMKSTLNADQFKKFKAYEAAQKSKMQSMMNKQGKGQG
jgi:hypothetical protein